MSKDSYIIVSDTTYNPEIDVYEKKKIDVVRGKLHRIFGTLQKEFGDVSDEYKNTLVPSLLLNLLFMIGMMESDKAKFLERMGTIYDIASEAKDDGLVNLRD